MATPSSTTSVRPCYQWYFISTGATSPTTDLEIPNTSFNAIPSQKIGIVGKLWIRSLDLATRDEQTGVATAPSKESREISSLFNTLGLDTPTIHVHTFGPPVSVQSTFNHALELWTLSINTTDATLAMIDVESPDLTIMGCACSRLQRPVSVIEPSSSQSDTPRTNTDTTRDLDFVNVYTDACRPSHSILQLRATSNPADMYHVYLLTHHYSSPARILPPRIRAAAVNAIGYFALTESNQLLLPNNTVIDLAAQFSAIASAARCETYMGAGYSPSSMAVVLWTTTAPPELTVIRPRLRPELGSYKYPVTHLDLVHLKLLQTVEFIHHLQIDPSTNTVLLYARKDATSDQILSLDLVLPGSPTVINTFPYHPAGGGKIHLSTARTRSLFQYYGNSLLYLVNGGKYSFEFRFHTRNPSLVPTSSTRLPTSESILQVATVPPLVHGNQFSVLTSTYRIFIGSTDSGPDCYEVLSPLLNHAGRVQLLYEATGTLVAFVTGQPWISRLPITVNQDLSVPEWNVAGIACPFLAMDTSLTPEYYLDVGESIQFTAQVTSSQKATGLTEIRPLVTQSNTSLITVRNVRPARPPDTTPFAQTQFGNYEIKPNAWDRPGSSSVTVSPSASSVACPKTSISSQINTMCPPTRHLRVRDHTPCSNLQSCAPVPAFYSYPWSPALDIYDGNTFVKHVHSDFLLVELNRVGSYSYLMTPAQAGCIRNPITSAELHTQFNTADIRSFKSWLDRSSCYRTDSDRPSTLTATSYEIMNYTSANKIIWGESRNQLYLFKAVVVDPTISYCKLSTDFYVQVYGAPLTGDVQVGMVIGFVTLILSVLGVSYYWYRMQYSGTKDKVD